jgi:hypothetical protein
MCTHVRVKPMFNVCTKILQINVIIKMVQVLPRKCTGPGMVCMVVTVE